MDLFFSLAAAAMGNIFYIHRHPFILKYFVDCGITVTADHLCYTGTAYIVGSALIGNPMLLATSQRSKRQSLEFIHTFLLFLRLFYIEKNFCINIIPIPFSFEEITILISSELSK